MRWALNVSSSYLKFILSMVIVFFMTPYIVSELGLERFGLWSLLFAVIGVFGLLDLGFATAGVKYVAEAFGAQDDERRNVVLSTLFFMYAGLGVLCVGVVSVGTQSAGSWFDLSATHQEDFRIAMWILGGCLAASLPLSVFRSAMTGIGQVTVVNVCAIAAAVLQAVLTVVLLKQGYGLRGLAIAAGANMLAQSVLLIPLCYRLLPGFSITVAKFSASQVRELGAFSIYAFIANVAVLIILRIDPVVIKMYLPLSAIAVYAIAIRIAEYALLLNKQFSNALMPLVSQSHGSGDVDTVRRVLIDGTRLLLGIALPFLGLLWFYAPELIELWMGPQFEAAAPLLRILLLAAAFSVLQLNAANVLGMTGAHRFVAFAMLGSAGLNLVLSILLVQYFELTGVASATLVAAFCIEMGLIVPHACRQRGTTYWQFLHEAVWPALPPLVPMFAAAWWMSLMMPVYGFVALLCGGVVSALVYFAAFWIVGVQRDEKEWVAQNVRALRPANL
ncbi:MAG: flippase [Gammaproteobacteria bacterium]|nr:flippase [Gammaproteobacteria bacterium]